MNLQERIQQSIYYGHYCIECNNFKGGYESEKELNILVKNHMKYIGTVSNLSMHKLATNRSDIPKDVKVYIFGDNVLYSRYLKCNEFN